VKIALIGLRLTVGPRLIVDTLGPALQRLGLDVLFLGEQGYTPCDGIPFIPVSNGATYREMVRDTVQRRLYRDAVDALIGEKPDICYFVSVHPANAPLAWALRRSVRTDGGTRPPVAMHIHDPLPHPGISTLAIFAAQQLSVWAADYVVTYGATLAGQVHRWYSIPRHRIVTIRHGASRVPRDTPPVEPATYRWFSFVGRIQRYKGLEIFLTAAKSLRETDPTARFYVGGAGEIDPYRRALDDLGDSVTVENRELTNEETDEVMQASWAVVLPYDSATQSGVIPVAYWNACPVIVTRVGGLEEVVRDDETGFIVERGDVAGIVGRMRQLAGNHPLRWRLGGGAFSFYDRWLRWERIAHDLVAGFHPALQPTD
jgi:starch synthase